MHSSSSDTAEHIVDNPTYGANETTNCDNTYDRVEQYSRSGPDYEPVARESNTEQHHTSPPGTIIPNCQEIAFDRTSTDSVQI